MNLTFGLRPRLRIDSPWTVEACLDRLLHATGEYTVNAFDRYLIIEVPSSHQHYWSPHLQLTLEEGEQGTTLVRGLITPRPAVWTLFAGIYGGIIVLGFFASLYGLAQWQLDQASGWLWSPILSIALLILVYSAAHVGQRLGREQTEELLQFLEHCLTRD